MFNDVEHASANLRIQFSDDENPLRDYMNGNSEASKIVCWSDAP